MSAVSPLSCPLFSPAPAADPWREVLVPALAGRPPALDRLDLDLPDHAAVAVRCLLLLGEPREADAALQRALDLDHPDAAALCWLLRRREVPVGRAGSDLQRADALVDQALRRRSRGRPAAAEHAARQALALVPHHAEARLVLALEATPPPRDLRPRPALGGCSPERLRRRLLGGAWGSGPVGPRRRAGILTRVLPAEVPDVALEAACDEVLGLLRLGLDPARAAHRCWARARTAAPAAVLAVAAWLPTLPWREPAPLRPLLRAAAEVLDVGSTRLPAAPPRSAQLVLPR